MIKILANDGINELGKKKLEDAGFQVDTEKVEQEELDNALPGYDVILVRSATKVREELINNCPNLKLIGRGGVGLDNIDVEYARSKGIEVINTPGASSNSVAELVIAHLFGMVRFLPDSNRQMVEHGSEQFKELKKKYAKGTELKGKTLGLIGIGRIGQETARIGIGIGMNVIACDPGIENVKITLALPMIDSEPSVNIKTISKDEVLSKSDFISLHVPFKKEDTPVIGEKEFDQMKNNVIIINCARGGCVNEEALLKALESNKVAYAGVDVYEEEPTNNVSLLQHPNVSLTPHIGAATIEAQQRIGLEIADKVIHFFK